MCCVGRGGAVALFVPSQTFVHVLNHLTMYTAELEILVAVVNVLVLLELVLRIAAYGKARHAAVTDLGDDQVATPGDQVTTEDGLEVVEN